MLPEGDEGTFALASLLVRYDRAGVYMLSLSRLRELGGVCMLSASFTLGRRVCVWKNEC